MKKIIIFGTATVIVILMLVFLIVPVLAQDGGTAGDPWQTMYQACRTGDFDTMIEACQRIWGGSDASYPNQGQSFTPAQEQYGCGGGTGWGMMGWR